MQKKKNDVRKETSKIKNSAEDVIGSFENCDNQYEAFHLIMQYMNYFMCDEEKFNLILKDINIKDLYNFYVFKVGKNNI